MVTSPLPPTSLYSILRHLSSTGQDQVALSPDPSTIPPFPPLLPVPSLVFFFFLFLILSVINGWFRWRSKEVMHFILVLLDVEYLSSSITAGGGVHGPPDITVD